jgi:hypothetical protein
MPLMAGRGPAPKDPSTRARRNKDALPTTVLIFVPGAQPELPKRYVYEYDEESKTRVRLEVDWPEDTLDWWADWGNSQVSKQFTQLDWRFLVDTARLHAAVAEGDLKYAGELRQRVVQFGTTPEARARLRIQYAAADEADEKVSSKRAAVKPPSMVNDPRQHLRAVK